MIVITGCSRSGTTYTAELCNRLGLDIGHEHLRRHGEVGWSSLPRLLAGRPDPGVTVLHQIRNPLETISSMRTHSARLLESVGRHFPTRSSVGSPEGKLRRCMEYWYHWNVMAAEAASWTFRIEAIDCVFEEFCQRLGVVPDRAVLGQIPRTLNSRRIQRFSHFQQPVISWGLLASLEKRLCQNIRELARRYGYGDQHLNS